jgi:RNA polymerase sigma-70 factor (ECF subfamily)
MSHRANASAPKSAEAKRLLSALTAGDKAAVMKVARLHAWKTPYDHEDLIQEAFVRVLDGRRDWPLDVHPAVFLAGVIRSIAWEWRSDSSQEDADIGDEGHEERRSMAKIDAMKVLDLFNDDPVAQKLVAGLMEGARGEELQAASGLDKTEYESKRRKIRRRIEKLLL